MPVDDRARSKSPTSRDRDERRRRSRSRERKKIVDGKDRCVFYPGHAHIAIQLKLDV